MTAEHRAANAALCQWLGIEPRYYLRWGNQETGGQHFGTRERAIEAAERFKTKTDIYRVDEVYPALDTREGFWVLRDALEKRHEQFQSGFNGSWHWAIVGPESVFTQEGEEPNVGVLARGEGEPAALFAAALALMDREKGAA